MTDLLKTLSDYALENRLEFIVHINPHLQEDEAVNIYQAVGTLIAEDKLSEVAGAECIKNNTLVEMILYPSNCGEEYLCSLGAYLEDCAKALLLKLGITI